MSTDGEILCGCGKPAVCAHVRSGAEGVILSCEDHEYDAVATQLPLSFNGWRKISIEEFIILAVMNS